MKRETIEQFQGKVNVIHIINDSGVESYLTQSHSFMDEAYSKGACKLNTVENETKHVLFLFNDKGQEVGRYYLGKKLQGKTPEELAELKHSIVFFETWNPDTKNWVLCVDMEVSTATNQDEEYTRDEKEDDIPNDEKNQQEIIKRMIPRKPIHVGMFLHKEKDKIYILTDKHKKVFFKSTDEHHSNCPIALDSNGREEKFYLFQYRDDGTSMVDYIGNIMEFTLVEVEYYNQAEEYFYGEKPVLFGVVKSKYHDGNKFSYHIDSDYIIKTHSRGGFLNLDGDFSEVENFLLNYIYREKKNVLKLEDYLSKKKEIKEHVESLDITNIISSYSIKKMSLHFHKRDMWHIWVSGLNDYHDRYIDSLLPRNFGCSFKIDDADDLSEGEKEEIRRYIAQEDSIKKNAYESYSKEEHIDTLLFMYLKEQEKKNEDYYNEYILPKLLYWNDKLADSFE